ncbi:MAG: thiamine pyrophosphate-dependent dehydrogenase E1 component subunit alpha [Sphingomonadaceae bacterium]|nr:thiamine pyrophosphate-dependent dehydrogenase E1 component subunit alpha [Sphingomonadaceae bacterium]
MDRIAALRSMMLIRTFEARLMDRPDHGFQLLSAGEEAVAVGVCNALSPDDQLLCSGRSIGPALARGLECAMVMAELLGKTTGTNQGRGGRGHLARPDSGFFGAHAVVGGNLTIAAGAALAAQQAGENQVILCLFGDGACGSGALHETMNIAALWNLPLVLVCNNNGLSVSTPPAQALAPSPLSSLAGPFGIAHATIDGMDVEHVAQATGNFVDQARRGEGPAFLECLSERFSSHSSATRDTRSNGELEAVRARCPIESYASTLQKTGLIDAAGTAELWADAAAEIERALAQADAAPFPDPAAVLADV